MSTPVQHPDFSSDPRAATDKQAALFTQAEMLAGSGLPAWIPPVYGEFRRHVLHRDYPCFFAVAGEQTGTLRYTIVEEPADGVSPAAVHELIRISREHPGNRHSLVAFVRPEPQLRGHHHYIRAGWDLLQKLHDQDSEPWPGDVPRSPTDPKWEFCFGGEPMFVFGAMPSHHRRRSRNLGPSLLLLFQPRSVFRGIEGGTPEGARVRAVIRKRLAAWDLAQLHSSMGDYGDPSNFEAAQYFIPDDDLPSPPCPLVIRGAADGAPPSDGNFPPAPPRATVVAGTAMSLDAAVQSLLPRQGSVEVQQDEAGRWHPLHTHPVDETLHVVAGRLAFHVHGQQFNAGPGTTIRLPAGTPHSSVAGPDGCIYLIAQRS
jgi:hypothetical protein